jgi:4-diphosphocytidyl-2-C-methyl-D-erythritol kinase
VVRRLYPEVGAALDWLAPRAHDGARLTGTGGCVFARFASAAEGEAVLAAMPARWTGFVARGVGESALLGRCRAG